MGSGIFARGIYRLQKTAAVDEAHFRSPTGYIFQKLWKVLFPNWSAQLSRSCQLPRKRKIQLDPLLCLPAKVWFAEEKWRGKLFPLRGRGNGRLRQWEFCRPNCCERHSLNDWLKKPRIPRPLARSTGTAGVKCVTPLCPVAPPLGGSLLECRLEFFEGGFPLLHLLRLPLLFFLLGFDLFFEAAGDVYGLHFGFEKAFGSFDTLR